MRERERERMREREKERMRERERGRERKMQGERVCVFVNKRGIREEK